MNQAEHDMLVLAAQDGGRDAFQRLVRHHHRSLLRFALSLCSNRALAQDAVQDAWVTVARRLRRLEDPRAFRSWVFRAVRWRVLDLLRSGHGGSAGADNERRLDLDAAIEALSPIDRQALELFYLTGLTVVEIAGVLEIPAGTVKSRLHRARNQLAQTLDGEDR